MFSVVKNKNFRYIVIIDTYWFKCVEIDIKNNKLISCESYWESEVPIKYNLINNGSTK